MALEEVVISGHPVCRGIAIGRLYILRGDIEEVPHYALYDEEIDEEIKRYRQATRKARQEIRTLQLQLKHEAIPEGASILEAHLQMLKDSLFTRDIERQIRALGKNAEYVFHQALQQVKTRFSSLSDPYFRERGRDIEDIGRRIMSHLTSQQKNTLIDIPPDSIVFSKDLTPSLVAEANQNRVAALVTEQGGGTSHAAIVAKAKGIPYISSIPYEALQDALNAQVVVDGRTGELILYPTENTQREYLILKKELQAEAKALRKTSLLDSSTADGKQVILSANIDVDTELDMLHQYGGDGIGLYRSEFVCMNLQRFPTEEEQYRVYRRLVEKLKGLPIVIRTFDVGGDKNFLNQNGLQEGNSFLGCRAIRFLLKEKEIFRAQIRAILRVAHRGDVSIMFPMVSALSELREAKALVRSVEEELKKERIPYGEDVKVGCMIEVPSAAIIADLLAQECDFFSIGTNDLVQYSLAVDRSDQSLSDFYTPTHPGIIRLIKMTVEAANHHMIPVSVCGEVAADPRMVPLLLGLGVMHLSVAARFLPEIKHTIRKTQLSEAKKLAQKALSMTTAHEIDKLLIKHHLK